TWINYPVIDHLLHITHNREFDYHCFSLVLLHAELRLTLSHRQSEKILHLYLTPSIIILSRKSMNSSVVFLNSKGSKLNLSGLSTITVSLQVFSSLFSSGSNSFRNSGLDEKIISSSFTLSRISR